MTNKLVSSISKYDSRYDIECENNINKYLDIIVNLSNRRHEDRGIFYLKYIGYKNNEILINGACRDKNICLADLTSVNDGQDWEVKIIVKYDGKFPLFSIKQIEKMDGNTNVLIFRLNCDYNDYFPEVVKLKDLVNIRIYSNFIKKYPDLKEILKE